MAERRVPKKGHPKNEEANARNRQSAGARTALEHIREVEDKTGVPVRSRLPHQQGEILQTGRIRQPKKS